MKCSSASGTRAMVAKKAGMCPKAPVSLSKMGRISGAACSLESGPISGKLAVAVDILVFLSSLPRLQIVSFLGADDARVQSDSAESAEESGVLDFNAMVHHYFKTGLPGALGGCFMD